MEVYNSNDISEEYFYEEMNVIIPENFPHCENRIIPENHIISKNQLIQSKDNYIQNIIQELLNEMIENIEYYNMETIENETIENETVENETVENETIENINGNIESIDEKENDIIAIDIKKKCLECTICTDSISDSDSEPESENYKCNICSNHVHPICLYNYGIYHELDDLNDVPCYVCEKGTLRPNNSIGRRLQAIADGLKRVPFNNRNDGIHERLLDEPSPRRLRREMLRNSGYIVDNSSDESNHNDNSSNDSSSNDSITEHSTESIVRRIERENSEFCCLLVKGITTYFCCVILIVSCAGLYFYYSYVDY